MAEVAEFLPGQGRGRGRGRRFIQVGSEVSSSIYSGRSEDTLISLEEQHSEGYVSPDVKTLAEWFEDDPVVDVPTYREQTSEDSGSVTLPRPSIASGSTSRSGLTLVSIPVSEFTLAFSSCESTVGGGTVGSYFNALSTQEKILECPYDSCHRIPEQNMRRHLEKCRQNYKLQVERRGDDVVTGSCKYNFKHQELPPEIVYHEERCPDRDRPPYYLFFLNPSLAGEEFIEKFSVEDLEEFIKAEVAGMREGLYVNEFVGGAHFHLTPKPFECIREPESRGQRRVDQDHRIQSRARSCELIAQNMERESEQKMDGDTTEDVDPDMDDEDEKYWNVPNKPGFDYMDSWFKSMRFRLWKYPPGLTRAQRREYDKYCTLWMSMILEADKKSEEMDTSTTDDYVTAPDSTTAESFVDTPVSTKGDGFVTSTNRSLPGDVVETIEDNSVVGPYCRVWKKNFRRFVAASFRSETTISGRSVGGDITDYSGVADDEEGASSDE